MQLAESKMSLKKLCSLLLFSHVQCQALCFLQLTPPPHIFAPPSPAPAHGHTFLHCTAHPPAFPPPPPTPASAFKQLAFTLTAFTCDASKSEQQLPERCLPCLQACTQVKAMASPAYPKTARAFYCSGGPQGPLSAPLL